MVGTGWYVVAHNDGAPGGDMIGHAATANWLRTLPWWDWRGWSDWFYGGQAVGVNYPPLGHAWMRFTDPVHGQMAAVAIGLLILLPWGALRLARAVGYGPRTQRTAVAAALVLTAASAEMWWFLSGFHSESTFFGSWPAMLAVVVGLHLAAWAACCERPLICGVVTGIALLFNATVVPGIAVVCAILLATSGASLGRALRWAVTAGAAALAVCAWWLVPFLASWTRLVRWEVPLSDTWSFVGTWGVTVLAIVGLTAAWIARHRMGAPRRLAVSALVGLLATLVADLFGYLRPERWLQLPILVAAVAAAGLFSVKSESRAQKPVRPAWMALGIALMIVFVVITQRLEALPLCLWLMWRPTRGWVWSTALAWAAVLLWVPLWAQIRNPELPERWTVTPMSVAAANAAPSDEGLVYVDHLYNSTAGDVRVCGWGNPWQATLETSGRVRPLFGLYRETSATSEFLTAEVGLRSDRLQVPGGPRPHWFEAWDAAGRPTLETRATAEALGARWYATCDTDDVPTVIELPSVPATGVSVAPNTDDDSWHRSAVEWWISIGAESDGRPFDLMPQASRVPVRWPAQARDYPPHEVAEGVVLRAAGDNLTVIASEAGWAWLRVPWDPYWRSVSGTPVVKGGPGHVVVWVDQGTTELRWSVPRAVDTAAVTVTGIALLATATLAVINRRRGFPTHIDRPRPISEAMAVFADTVDGWWRGATRKLREATGHTNKYRG